MLWSIIGESGFVVSSVVPSTQALLSGHILTGKTGTRPVGTVVSPAEEPPQELNRLLLPKYFGNQWQPYNRIRDKEGFIMEGTYVTAVSGDTLTLSRSLPPGTPSKLNLYDADVRGLNTTQVF